MYSGGLDPGRKLETAHGPRLGSWHSNRVIDRSRKLYGEWRENKVVAFVLFVKKRVFNSAWHGFAGLPQSLYDSIKKEPFKIPEDDGNDLAAAFFNPDKEGWLLKQGSALHMLSLFIEQIQA